jgi:hypothetical protein
MRPQLPKEAYGEAANGYDRRILRRSMQSYLPHCSIQKTDGVAFVHVSDHYQCNPLKLK